MAEARHTPGPWTAGRYSNYAGWAVSAPERGCIAERWYKSAEHVEAIYDDGEMEANARLIAAAPDLLATLEEIAKGEGPFNRDPLEHASNVIEHAQQIAREAIEKATGDPETVSPPEPKP